MEKAKLNKPVFVSSSGLIIVLLIFAVIFPQTADSMFKEAQNAIVENGSWFYVFVVATILVYVVYIGLSRHGDIRLGPDHAKPAFSFITWLSMLFAAGMGIGLMFFGVAEPLMHFIAPPTAKPESIAALKEAMRTTFFHWGLHAWAIYAVVALVLGYFAFRMNLPLTLRSALYPLIGDRIYGPIGHAVDVFAVTSTIFGVATSLGYGAAQINAGLNFLVGLPENTTVQILLMAGVVSIAIVSVVSGLDKGIKILSETNMALAVALLIFILVLGPTVFLLQAYIQNIGAYLSDIVRNTFNLFAYEKTDWIGGWTIFYWGWWLAWAPFVGVFIARISFGRTLREFVIGVLFVPTAFTFLWMTVFGNAAIDQVINGNMTLSTMASNNTPVALFVFLEQFPMSDLLTIVALLMVIVFFVTSCDSGAMVVDMLCSHGSNNTPVWQRIYWAVGVGVVAAILLYAGGLGALQTMTIVSALPFAIIILIAMMGLIKALRIEGLKRDSQLVTPTSHAISVESEGDWKEKLNNLISYPERNAVTDFLRDTIYPALDDVGKEFRKNGFDAELTKQRKAVVLTVSMGDDPDFIYSVWISKVNTPDAGMNDDAESADDDSQYYRAEVHLSEGGQDYDIMGWSRLGIINDVIEQYQKHQHFLHLIKD